MSSDESIQTWNEQGPDGTNMLQKVLGELGQRIALGLVLEAGGRGTYTIDVDLHREIPIKVSSDAGHNVEIRWNPKRGGN